MNILVVNDDGIRADGIICLSEMAKEFGQVWVVAPAQQCSAMSHRITIKRKLKVVKEEFPVEGVHAYSVDGTPADCVKAGIHLIMPEKPDIVFSGINHGYNAGCDIVYSGTVGAAMDALQHDIPSIAYSTSMGAGSFDMKHVDFSVAKRFFSLITRGIFEQGLDTDGIWNVNFPGCSLDQVQGILWNRIPAKKEFYFDHFAKEVIDQDSFYMEMINIEECEDAEDGTDIHALIHNCISVGRVKNLI